MYAKIYRKVIQDEIHYKCLGCTILTAHVLCNQLKCWYRCFFRLFKINRVGFFPIVQRSTAKKCLF